MVPKIILKMVFKKFYFYIIIIILKKKRVGRARGPSLA